MYLSSQELARSHRQTLQNLLSVSGACIDAGARLSDLWLRAGQAIVATGNCRLDPLANAGGSDLAEAAAGPASDELAAARIFEAACTIVADAHRAMIRTAEAQVRIVDAALFAFIERASRSSPPEGEIALAAMRTTLRGAEQALQGMTNAAVQSLGLAEEEVHLVATALSEPPAGSSAPKAAKAAKATKAA